MCKDFIFYNTSGKKRNEWYFYKNHAQTTFPIASISYLSFSGPVIPVGSMTIGSLLPFLKTESLSLIGPSSVRSLSILTCGLWYLISAAYFLKNWNVGPMSLA